MSVASLGVALPAKLERVPPEKLDRILSKDQFVALARHMMNGNPISHFLVVRRDGDRGAKYSKARPNRRADSHARWAWDTITDKAKIKTSLGFYAKNQDNQSTWGALDFDAHSSGADLESQKQRAIRAFTLLLEYRDRYLILSASGRGYHVFMLANEPRPVAEWNRVLTDTVSLLPEGQCELFSADGTEKHPVGKVIRMPGTYNPSSDSVELIIAETIRPLLDSLERSNTATLKSHSFSPRQLIRDREANSYSYSIALPFWTEEHAPKEKLCLSTKIASKSLAKSRSFTSPSTDKLVEQILLKYPIKQKSARNDVLVSLAGDCANRWGA